MKKNIYKISTLCLILIISIELFNIIYYKYKEEKNIISYYNNETNYNYKNTMIINIPSIGLNYSVKKADNNFRNLNRNLVYYKNKNYAEKIIIFGHSGMGFGIYFNRIDEISYNDEAKLYMDNKEITYFFDKKYSVLSSDISVLKNDEKKVLLLITCDKNNKNKRLVVKFILKGSKIVKK